MGKLYAMSTLGAPSQEEDRRRLKELSDSRIQNWPNTVTAIRKKKEAERFEKFKKDELERRELEQDEARFQAGEKRQLLDRCKKQIWDRVDRVKAFHSKLLVSDALNERELQKEISAAQKDHKQQVNGWHHDQLIEKCIEYDTVEAKKKQALADKRQLTQQVLRNQHDEFKRKHIEVLQEEILEGELIKRKAIQANAKAKAEEDRRRIQLVDAQREQFRQNEIAKSLKLEIISREKEEDEKIYQYGIQKQKELDARKVAEQCKAAEKRAHQQKMIVLAEGKLKDAMNKEQAFLIKQKKETEEKKAEEERIKLQRKAYLKQTMEDNRQIWMKEQVKGVQAEKDENKKFQEQWRLKNMEIENRERVEVGEIRQMNTQLAQFHKKQAEEKELLREQQFYEDMKDAKTIGDSLKREDQEFMNYAERAVSTWQAGGKNVTPMILELQKQKKANMAVL